MKDSLQFCSLAMCFQPLHTLLGMMKIFPLFDKTATDKY